MVLRLATTTPSAAENPVVESWLAYTQPVDLAAASLDGGSIGDRSKGWPRQIPRVKNLTLPDYQRLFEGRSPVIMERRDMPCLEEGWLQKAILGPFGKERIAFGAMHKGNNQFLAAPLHVFVDNVKMNTKDTWAYMQDEFFLLRHPELGQACPPRPLLMQEGDHFPLLPRDLVPGDAYLLWGGKYSRSKLHVDPFNWTGTNLVLHGKKRWRLLPPGGHDRKLKAFEGSCGFALECVKYQSPLDLFSGRIPKGLPLWEGTTEPGDMLVIPTGWWHQAYNLASETVAIASQAITRSGGSWSAIAEVVKHSVRTKSGWDWSGLPPPPADGGSGLDEQAANRLFSEFSSAIPAVAIKQGMEKHKEMRKQLEL